jgi:ribosomal protein L32
MDPNYDFSKARKRIKRQFLTGKKQPRVVLDKETKTGIYRFKHHVFEVKFRVDSLGRTYFNKN